MSTDWIDVQISSSVDAGELPSSLGDESVTVGWQAGENLHLYWPSERWSPDRYHRLRQVLQHWEGTGEPGTDILIRIVPHEDCNRHWVQSVQPLFIGKRIVVRPSWESVELHPPQFDIVVDPKQVFGTGHHTTTRLLLEWLEELIHGGESVLDVGTGSGFLAMVALRLGARYARGIDNDPVAIECAAEYARINGFGGELVLECDTLSRRESFDLVLANLDRRALLSLAGELAAVTRHRLVVSGLLIEQRQNIVTALAEHGLYHTEQREADGWIAIEFTPPQLCEGA